MTGVKHIFQESFKNNTTRLQQQKDYDINKNCNNDDARNKTAISTINSNNIEMMPYDYNKSYIKHHEENTATTSCDPLELAKAKLAHTF